MCVWCVFLCVFVYGVCEYVCNIHALLLVPPISIKFDKEIGHTFKRGELLSVTVQANPPAVVTWSCMGRSYVGLRYIYIP